MMWQDHAQLLKFFGSPNELTLMSRFFFFLKKEETKGNAGEGAPREGHVEQSYSIQTHQPSCISQFTEVGLIT